MSTTPTERRLAITPDPMNNPKDMLVSDPSALARELFPMQNRMPSWAVGRQRARQETAERTIEKLRPVYESELTKLRAERDELVGALRDAKGMVMELALAKLFPATVINEDFVNGSGSCRRAVQFAWRQLTCCTPPFHSLKR